MGDLPKAGDVQIRARVDSLEEMMLDPGDPGVNIDWEFAWLNYFGGSYVEAVDSVMWIDNTSTIESDSFPMANIAQRSNCYFFHNWQTHAISLECYNRYYTIDNLGLHLIGTTYPNIHTYRASRNLFPLLNYGDTLVETSREVINLSSDSVYVTYIIDTTIVDGWGTVHTPIDDLESLRFHTIESVWDSLYVNNVGEQVNHMPDNYYYRWYSKELGFPVFQISKGVLEYQSQYQVTRFKSDLKRVSSESIGMAETDIIVSPNPVINNLVVSIRTSSLNNLLISITDIQGRDVLPLANIFSTGDDNYVIPCSTLSPGIYVVKIQAENMPVVCRKIIKN